MLQYKYNLRKDTANMNKQNLDKWAKLLLDTGKRNNLINFRDVRVGSVDILKPDFSTLFEKIGTSATLEVFSPSVTEDGKVRRTKLDDEYAVNNNGMLTKESYVAAYAPKLKKSNQILTYNPFANPLLSLKNISKRARSAIEETGVNIAYLAFGFVNWKENNHSEEYRAPLLLCPISIENVSSVEPFYVKVTDDVLLNPTFAFKLQSEFGIKLPEYNDETANAYIKKVAALVKKLGWTVSAEAKIGVFSFLKINMYRDIIDNAETIVNNVNVRALNGENVDQTSAIAAIPTIEQPDNVELRNVVDADSSQAAAVRLARSGKSFVLQGPPGTGKSQTITNIIAECLATGKKVLFVSEKLAALNVVFDKLKDAGLAEFCLQLHSHKANKKDVIEELCTTLRLEKTTVSSRADEETATLHNAQSQLDSYDQELHKRRNVIGKSLYELLEIVSSLRNTAEFPYEIGDVSDRGSEYITRTAECLSQYAEYEPTIGYDYRTNPWYGYKNTDNAYQTAMIEGARFVALQHLCTLLNKLSLLLTEKYQIEIPSVHAAQQYRKFFKAMGSSKAFTPTLFDSDALVEVTALAEQMSQIAQEIQQAQQQLAQNYDEDIFKLDGKDIYKKLTVNHSNGLGRAFSSEYKKLAKSLQMCRKDGKRPSYAEAVKATETLREFQRKTDEFFNNEKMLDGRIACYKGVNTDWDSVLAELKQTAETIRGLEFGTFAKLTNEQFTAQKSVFNNLAGWLDAAFCDEEDINKLANNFDTTQFDLLGVSIAKTTEKASKCIAATEQLDNWCRFRKLTDQLSELAAMDFVDTAISNGLSQKTFADTFKKLFFIKWVDKVLQECPTLSQLSRIPHDNLVETYAEKDRLQFEINKAVVKAKLSSQRPDLQFNSPRSQASILLREGEKKRKQKPIRQLLAETWQLTQTLKPCFLMSPLSVSTFLGPDMNFDAVIFDEASQIFPQDAVGAIYRGNQLIVVGDGQQMPPSNFFNTVADNEIEEEDDDITDFESILDLCSTTLPQLRLKWHYRSRFEQLIAFSNKNYYNNDLVTFPAAERNRKGFGVDYYHVNGTFDRTSRTNKAEAEFIVDLIFDNIKRFPDRSLGVVTFSVSQQDLVDKLLTKRRQDSPATEDFFRADKAEPFFIKNLETVQGDERDTVIIGVAYGKDMYGKLLHNFGPLNRAGGERRLNVAVTRAKYNVQVVSSMRATDIDLSKTQSVGAKLLRDYLDYAEHGTAALTRTRKTNMFETSEVDFETEIAEFLKGKGYDVETNVGCSTFQIDIAVKLPRSNVYALAIECDGSTYHSSANARDRDRLRKDILQRMGWQHYRVWSTDWFRNKKIEQDRLVEAVDQALANAKANSAATTVSASTTDFSVVMATPLEFGKYVYADIDSLYAQNSADFQAFVKAVLQVEAPVAEDQFLKRIVRVFNKGKVTQNVIAEWNKRMRGCTKNGIARKKGFLYLTDVTEYHLRAPAEGDKARNVNEVAIEELAAGLMETIKHNGSIDKTILYNFVAQQLGYSRAGEAMTARLNEALSTIKRQLKISDDIITMK